MSDEMKPSKWNLAWDIYIFCLISSPLLTIPLKDKINMILQISFLTSIFVYIKNNKITIKLHKAIERNKGYNSYCN